jgi:hypothetical protein
MGAVADEIPRAPAEGQEIGEDGRTARAPELSRDAWRDLFARLAAGDSSALEPMYGAAAGPVFGLALWRMGSVEDASDVARRRKRRATEPLLALHHQLQLYQPPPLLAAHHQLVPQSRRLPAPP